MHQVFSLPINASSPPTRWVDGSQDPRLFSRSRAGTIFQMLTAGVAQVSRREISSNGSVAKRDARSARPTNTPCPGSCADGDGQRDPSPSWWTSCKFRIFFVSFQPRPLEGAAGSVRCESVFHDAGDRRNGGQVGHGPPALLFEQYFLSTTFSAHVLRSSVRAAREAT